MKRIYIAGQLERFWSKVDRTGDCWVWLGALDRKGYGRFSVGNSRHANGTRRNSMVGAHRFSFEQTGGPAGSLFVLHRCDNPRCVRPEHLFLGTNLDNVRDMDAKGRRVSVSKRGSEHGNAVLDEASALRIYQLASSREITGREIARQFGVCFSTVSHIKTGRLWSHVTGVQR